ncbi:MAG: hypothetical protein ACHQE6_05945 [Solirubrobacterales bacterium]
MTKSRPLRLTALAAASLFLAIAASADSAGVAAPNSHTAHTAGVVKATDTAKLHYIKHSGSQLLEEGSAQGTLPGSMRAHCNLGTTFTASFTIYTNGGTINGHGTATPHDTGLYESFAGKLTITGGTGRYTHAHGHAGLYGTFNRRTYALVIQTTGSLSY